jgi:hypothetical protein
MAKVPPPKGKGEPPQPGQTAGNLEAPERVDHEPLNFKVPRAFRREFKTYAAQQGKSMSRVLQEAFAALKHESTTSS